MAEARIGSRRPTRGGQGRQQQLEREHIRAERLELFVSDRELSVDGGLAKHGLTMYQHVLLLLFLDRRLLA
jgi:hypothetical protein